jgi:uncharacterized protein
MQYTTLGKTGLRVSRVGFGAIKLPEVSDAQAADALNRALDMGVNFIDTARNYTTSERKIGTVLKARRDEVIIATKTGARDAAGARRDLEISMGNLQVDRLDLWQLHNVMDLPTWERVTAPDGALAAARAAKAEGLVDHLGITIHRSLDVMREAIRSGEFETILLLYNIMDEEGVARHGILDLAQAHNVGVIIMKAFSGGSLCLPMDAESRAAKRAADPDWYDPIVRGCLHHVLSHPAVDMVIPGMRSVAEVEEDVPVADMPVMTDEEREALVRLIGEQEGTYKYEQDCLRCGYCVSTCPQEIPIPDAFHAAYAYQQYPESTKYLGVRMYEDLAVSPEACLRCGSCMEVCPAGIPIPERLEAVVDLFAGAVG